MPLPWQRTFCHCRKMSLAHLHPKTNICAKFHENRSKTEEVVRDANMRPPARPTAPFFGHMPLPWQRTFCHCRKMSLAHLHPKTNICAKFHENRSKTEEVVRDANLRPPARQPHFWAIICRYHGNALFATVEKCLLHIYTPRQISVLNFMRIGQKLRK